MAKKVISIVGLTGSQGGSVADVFLKEGGWHVRGLTRDTSKPTSQAWAAKGVELVKANINEPSSLVAAFAGSTVIFGVTDFWGVVHDPSFQAIAASSGRALTEVAYDAEVQQAKNIIDAANATHDTLERFVFSTLSAAKEWSEGKYVHNLHFDAKWKGVEYLRASYPTLATKTSFLQVGLYINNWKKGLTIAQPRKQPDGTFVFNLPMDGDALVPMVEARQDTGKFAKALVEVAAGQNLLGYGSLISWNEFARLWGRQHGVTCRFERIDRKVLEDAIPGGIGEELADMFGYIGEFGYDGRDPTVVHPKDLGVPVQVYTAEEYIRDEEWADVGSVGVA